MATFNYGKYVSRLPANTDPQLARALADVFRDLLGDIYAASSGGGGGGGGGDKPTIPYHLARRALYTMYMDAYNETLSTTPGFSFTTIRGSNISAVRDTTNAVKAINRLARRTSGSPPGVGWNIGVTPSNPFCVVFPRTTNDCGFTLGIVCGFDDLTSAALADVEFLFGMNSNTAAMPASGALLTTSASNWFGLYGQGGSVGFGYKASGTTSITQLHSLSTGLYAPYSGFYLLFEVSPADSSVNYSVSTISAVGTLTPLVSGSTLAYAPGGVSMAPAVSGFRPSGTGDFDLFVASVVAQANIIGNASL